MAWIVSSEIPQGLLNLLSLQPEVMRMLRITMHTDIILKFLFI